eukprot:TRINITY_DN412_c0_g1_i2.p2 TRINITY_DN412_c0_g1~~TRINITY_DN412_c0_g1_i2.p2  ORF type:complete len:253 (-),score=49.00 TRINITY_DN412_c0_g1_i2:190-948(-)
MLSQVIKLCLLVAVFGSSSRQILQDQDYECPPPGFDALSPFGLDDLEEYISSPWYIQQQMPVSYQPADALYCVRAEYVPLDASDISKGVNVVNYANKDQVNGPPTGTSGAAGSNFPLIAIVPNADQASRLRVGIKYLRFIQRITFGDYWIVATGSTANNTKYEFDWAIISGGAPNRETENGCSTGYEWDFFRRFQTNGVGLWLFTREQVASNETIEVMRAEAEKLGFDTSVLANVEQEGCLYEGFPPMEDKE